MSDLRRVFPEGERRAFFVAALRMKRRSSAPGDFSEYPGRFLREPGEILPRGQGNFAAGPGASQSGPGECGKKDRGPRPEERAAEWRRAGFGRWAARRRAMFGKEAEAAVAFFVGEGRKSPNRREKGEGRRSATPSPISQAREASASLRCGGFECLGSVGAAQRRGAGSPGRFVFALSGV